MGAPGPVPPSLRLDRVAWPVRSLGPGQRVGLWLQGCSLGCAGCVSPSLWSTAGGRDVGVRTLADAIAAIPECQGVTLSGGEPFEQYGPLMALCAYLKALRPGDGGAPALDIGVYSGYRLDELMARHPDRTFLRVIDWLIDGRYERDRPADDGVRGSSNQRFYRFVGGQPVEQAPPASGGRVDLAVLDGDSAVLAMVPRSGELASIAAGLREAGLSGSWR